MIGERAGSIWFLTGSQHLYGEETLRRVQEHSRQIAAALDDCEAIPVAIVDREPLTDAGAIRRALAQASADEAWLVARTTACSRWRSGSRRSGTWPRSPAWSWS